ncbi:hypothetical protein SCHPADRAFT_137051 [Schizopora paradoxa]|uniref:Uncharacterized protein n=1 Tax=Schizopora paradoxa TaxID=27342 RepID=A0A0H2SM11_9AGAM|nr:hypothetical protein SCHPADRAFT_137051 [Schizopora paradoxa]
MLLTDLDFLSFEILGGYLYLGLGLETSLQFLVLVPRAREMYARQISGAVEVTLASDIHGEPKTVLLASLKSLALGDHDSIIRLRRYIRRRTYEYQAYHLGPGHPAFSSSLPLSI